MGALQDTPRAEALKRPEQSEPEWSGVGGAKGEEEEPKSERPEEKVCRVRTQQSKTPTMIRTTLARKPNILNLQEEIISQKADLLFLNSWKNTIENDPANMNGF